MRFPGPPFLWYSIAVSDEAHLFHKRGLKALTEYDYYEVESII